MGEANSTCSSKLKYFLKLNLDWHDGDEINTFCPKRYTIGAVLTVQNDDCAGQSVH